MRRSKLELHVDILKALACHGPLNITYIMYRVNVSCSFLKYYLDFLIRHNLVEEQTSHKKRVVYAITERGLTLLDYFRELDNALPIVEENPEVGT